MLYNNNSAAALAACERERTGNYGADEYKETIHDFSKNHLPHCFKFGKETQYYDKRKFKVRHRAV